ncbi:uncharacterized protein LOC111333977 isoform X1 [Stylophora pistillata]|uniref:uncharacterized protein LOC111333977 isoform X1 n=1 Tax=Stylophora pistillata TaxID=50429 RepID=UPI000C044884|nr:uncharacterized protein LOC111333977 isoform X1 [Stylophora pistillata]
MDKRPLFLGRGRGRGRGNEQNSTKPTGRNVSALSSSSKWGSSRSGVAKNTESPKTTEVSRERQEKANKIKESAKKYLEKLDDEFEESSEDEEINDGEILNKTLQDYRNTSQDNEADLTKTAQYLFDSCKPGSSVCLICIASIKHVDASGSQYLMRTLHLLAIKPVCFH